MSEKGLLPIKRICLQSMFPRKVRKYAVSPDRLSKISSHAIFNIPKHWNSTKTRRSCLN